MTMLLGFCLQYCHSPCMEDILQHGSATTSFLTWATSLVWEQVIFTHQWAGDGVFSALQQGVIFTSGRTAGSNTFALALPPGILVRQIARDIAQHFWGQEQATLIQVWFWLTCFLDQNLSFKLLYILRNQMRNQLCKRSWTKRMRRNNSSFVKATHV